MRKRWMMIAAIIGIVLIGAVAVGPIMSDVETPDYEVIKSEGDIEIRQYAPMIIAEVQMSGKREEAIGDGFRLLADYIFGNNRVKQEITMTAPVQLAIGLSLLIFGLLGYFVNPAFSLGAAFFGAGLTNAGLTGWCGLAKLMEKMPWNQ